MLVADRFLARVEGLVQAEPIGELALEGCDQAVATHNIVALGPGSRDGVV